MATSAPSERRWLDALARAVSRPGPAQEAATAYATHLAEQRGAASTDLAARERSAASPGAWGEGLSVAHRLYCAELAVLARLAVGLVQRLEAMTGSAFGVGEALRRICGAPGESPRPELTGLLPGPLVSWLGVAEPELLESLRLDLGALDPSPDPLTDRAQQQLERLLPDVVRHDLGIHYTPGWVAREVVRRGLERSPHPATRVMDPACGTGVFLLQSLGALWQGAGSPSGSAVWSLLGRISGVEASPLVAAIARLSLLEAGLILAGQPPAGPLAQAVAVHAGDVLCDLAVHGEGLVLTSEQGPQPLSAVELVVGNPPWVAWDALPAGYKERLASGLLTEYALFELGGFAARLGGANDDLSLAFTLVALDRLVVEQGHLAFLLKLNLLTNESSRSFRRFQVARSQGGAAVDFSVVQLCDLRQANPFAAAVEPALYVLARDRPMGDRLPSERWERRRGALSVVGQADYTPVRAARDPAGPWALRSASRQRSAALSGTFPYEIRHGLKHDCNSVFLVALEAAAGADQVRLRNRPRTARRIRAPDWSGRLERRYLRPLLQSRHLRPLAVTGWAHALVPVDERGLVPAEELARRAPRTHAYLESMRDVLAQRRSRVFSRPPFYRVFGVGPYNWAPSLVVWCGMALRPWFAVVDRVDDPVLGAARPVPDSSCYLVPLSGLVEACYLAGLLNSSPVRDFLASRSSGSKRGLSRAVIGRLGLPAFDAQLGAHRDLAAAAQSLVRLGEPPVPDDEIADRLDPLASAVLS